MAGYQLSIQVGQLFQNVLDYGPGRAAGGCEGAWFDRNHVSFRHTEQEAN